MLIKCPECNQRVSDTADSCPHCGYSRGFVTGAYDECERCRKRVKKGSLVQWSPLAPNSQASYYCQRCYDIVYREVSRFMRW